ncbi:hypothetical protein EXW51_22195 [Bacillus mycoides]|nr:hypothetical protein EXW51_22195 [Bacillus mycoides]
MVSVNQHIYKCELQFWSFFFVVLLCMKEKTDFFRYQYLRCKYIFRLQIGWYRDFFAPIGFSDRGFFYLSHKQILNNSESYDKIL